MLLAALPCAWAPWFSSPSCPPHVPPARDVGLADVHRAQSEAPSLPLRAKPHQGRASGLPGLQAGGDPRATAGPRETPPQPEPQAGVRGPPSSSRRTRGSAGKSQTPLQPQEAGRGPQPRSHKPGLPSGSLVSFQTSLMSKQNKQQRCQASGEGRSGHGSWLSGFARLPVIMTHAQG